MSEESLAAQMERIQSQHWNIAHACRREKEMLMLMVVFASHVLEAGTDLSAMPAINCDKAYAQWVEQMRKGYAQLPAIFSRIHSTAMVLPGGRAVLP